MELFKCLFGVSLAVLFLICDVSAQNRWAMPVQQHHPYIPPHEKVPPPEAPFDKCLVEESEKIQCGPQDINAEQCENINCCFYGQHCYYGKAVTVQCTRDGQFVVVVARDATVPAIDVDSVSLLQPNDPSCNPVDFTAAFVIFQFPVTACGTTTREEVDYVVYENHMSSSYEVGVGPKGTITRDSHFELLFQCRYSGTSVEALILEVNPLPPPEPVADLGPLNVELKLGSGKCHAKGCSEEEAAYSSFYTQADFPVTKVLREPVYVEVNIVGRSDPNLVLNLEHCWATADHNPHSLPKWDLLVDGCPNHDDRYMTLLVPVGASSGLPYPTHHKRFVLKMFTFVDPTTFTSHKDMVFIHCATAVCHPSSTDSCEQPCHRQRRAAGALRKASRQKDIVSSGEVILTPEGTTSSTNSKS